jgi:hypothetical protein
MGRVRPKTSDISTIPTMLRPSDHPHAATIATEPVPEMVAVNLLKTLVFRSVTALHRCANRDPSVFAPGDPSIR